MINKFGFKYNSNTIKNENKAIVFVNDTHKEILWIYLIGDIAYHRK
ncbi:hypothetical protein [uncultured Algibacter sp.]|nr:hypothetical protein [uncultured Algibacter sp.]